jgi:hypothetical protein
MSTTGELPYGLRRRHQAGPLLQRDGGDNNNNGNNNNIDDPGGGVEEEGDADVNISNNTVNEDGIDIVSQQPHNNNHNNTSATRSQTKGIGVFQISRVYIMVSVVLAVLAIILAPISTPKIEYHWMMKMMNRAAERNRRGMIPRISSMTTKVQNDGDVDTTVGGDAYTGIVTKSFEEMITRAALMGITAGKQKRGIETKLSGDGGGSDKDSSESGNIDEKQQQERERQRRHLSLFENYDDSQENKPTGGMPTQRRLWWSKFLRNDEATNDRSRRGGNDDTSTEKHNDKQRNNGIEWKWIDPVLLEHSSFHQIVTNIIDKILKSTIRLCVITNYIVAMIYLLHSVVAAWFLLHSRSSNNTEQQQQQQGQHQGDHPAALVTDWAFASTAATTSARERMVGFLVFKLLLISAVVEPDTLDLMILVTWFTLLGCLRNLDHLAHSTNTHLTAMGQPPKTGVVQLLFLVLACDIVAACSCYTLLHPAGWDIVLLLNCDCALLFCDTIGHILKYYQCVLEDSHDATITELETRQLNLHGAIRNNNNVDDIADGYQEDSEDNVVELSVEVPVPMEEERQTPAISTMTSAEIRQELRQLDRRMEGFELKQNHRLSILDSAIFYLKMTSHILTVGHFFHTWSLYGVRLTLIDGIISLHIYSTISAACTKVARRRNIHNISRNLNGLFPDATDEELKKASISGDVCCICLGTMSTGGNVKKIACGHLFHTHCLREVIEREQNLQAAKCPLCRAPLADSPNSAATGSPTNTIHNNNNINTAAPERNIPVAPPMAVLQQANDTAVAETEAAIRDAVPVRQAGRERALFRFSTEGILPIWLPFPAFSFEVVRRPALGAQVAAAHIQYDQTVGPIQSDEDAPTIPIDQELNPELENDNQIQQQQQQQQETQISFIRRLLMLAGAIPMSPEEEARALTQLVDMFPQYNRSDLSRELRNRGSLEAVTEAILMGIFSGVPRGE